MEIFGFNGFEVGEELIIPQKIKEKKVVGIGKEAFSNMMFKKAVLPERIRYIEEAAFQECENLASINFPDSLRRLGPMCFWKTRIQQVKIPLQCREIPLGCFEGCSHLRKVSLNDGLKKICDYAFKDTDLKSIIIPSSVEQVGMFAFENLDAEVIEISVLGEKTKFKEMNSDAVIYCLAGSEAQKQARLSGCTVKPLSEFKNL